MNKLNIDLLDIKYISVNEIDIKVNYSDLEKIMDNKTIYDVKCIKKEGLISIKDSILKNKYIIIFIVFFLSLIYILSNLIFYVDIVTNDFNMEARLRKYLANRGICKYHFKKSYKDITKIKNSILKEYKNEIDWIEIENKGSKYIIRYEPRVLTKKKKENKFQNIIAKKNAIIYSMDVKNGQIVKNRFDYVKKGDVIVSGYIYLNDKINDTVKSIGNIYGETWYKVRVKYPLNYKQVIKTNEKSKVITLKFLNKKLEFFDFKNYKNYEYKDKILIFNNILPISINLREKRKVKVYKESNTYKEAIDKSLECAKRELLKKIKKGYIKNYQILNSNNNKGMEDVTIFFSVIENITDYEEISEYNIGNNNE